MVWPPSRPTATAKDAAEEVTEDTVEDTVEEGTREAITARERLRPSQGMAAMEDILAAMAGATVEATAEVIDLMVVAMAATLEAMEAHMEDIPEEAMVTVKERLIQDTAPMDLMEVAMGAIAPGTDLTEAAMVATPEAADHTVEVTATGGNYLALETSFAIQLFILS